jgi:pyridoxine 5-phosphate synthase
MAKLCVNIDHVATIRQARKEAVPDPVEAAKIVEAAGAAGVTVHLREDRRHINDKDVENLKKIVKTKFNLEMSINKDIVDKALKIVPDEATIVPEKRQELTTEGGMDVIKYKNQLKDLIRKLHGKKIIVSLFINPDFHQIKASKECGADCIEIHTGRYSNAKNRKAINRELYKIKKAAYYAYGIGLRINAGHGLTYSNVDRISNIRVIEDLNIGHNIVSRAVLVGMYKATKEMIKAMKN